MANAQTLGEPTGPGSERPQPPEFQDQEEPVFVLPEIRPAEKDKLYDTLQVYVKHFEITGNKVISDDELQAITAPYENRKLTSAEIQEVRRNITLYYINKGYINSGALLPDQKITDGIVKLYIIEGD
jgi:hemolysin activation/secretion protein